MNLDSEKLKDKTLSLLREFVIYAHKDKLERDGDYVYDPAFTKEPLSIDFNESTMLSYDGMEITESGGTYWLRFKTTGELEVELISADMPSSFTILLVNENFRDVIYIDQYFNLNNYLALALFEKFDKDINTFKLTKTILNLEKILLFNKIKFSSN
jgi:hypothetical protein